MSPQVFNFHALALTVCILGTTLVNNAVGSSSLFSVYAKASWNTLCSSVVGDKDEGIQTIATRQTLDLSTAQVAANLASIAYCYNFDSVKQWKCTRCHLVPEFVLEASIVDSSWDVHSYLGYYPPWDAKVIVFRGTDNHRIRNWLENLRTTQHHIRMNGDGLEGCRVHDGFSRMWNIGLKSRVLDALHALQKKYGKNGPLYIIGHSSGGATAQLAAVNIKLTQKVGNIYLYTFGAPRVGDKAFAQKVAELMTESWRFTNGRDIVPTLPWKSMGFWHSGQEVFQHKRKTRTQGVITDYKTCDGSGEDPHGHNSMCRFGFGCNSISDHLHYMNVLMENDGIC